MLYKNCIQGQMMRDLAFYMQDITNFDKVFHNEELANEFFFQNILGSRCGNCRGNAERYGKKVYCIEKCRKWSSLTSHTPFKHTKISIYHWLAAIWQTHVSCSASSSHQFSRKYEMRAMTAWSLLHRTRKALLNIHPHHQVTVGAVLKRDLKNESSVALSTLGGEMHAVSEEHAICTDENPAKKDALLLGHLRAVITAVHRGVKSSYLGYYCAEYSRRFGLVYRYQQRNPALCRRLGFTVDS